MESYDGVTRDTYNAVVSAYDLADTYFPPWRMSIQDGGAMGEMCSYNEGVGGEGGGFRACFISPP